MFCYNDTVSLKPAFVIKSFKKLNFLEHKVDDRTAASMTPSKNFRFINPHSL